MSYDNENREFNTNEGMGTSTNNGEAMNMSNDASRMDSVNTTNNYNDMGSMNTTSNYSDMSSVNTTNNYSDTSNMGQTNTENSGIYHFTPDEMRANGNNTYYNTPNYSNQNNAYSNTNNAYSAGNNDNAGYTNYEANSFNQNSANQESGMRQAASYTNTTVSQQSYGSDLTKQSQQMGSNEQDTSNYSNYYGENQNFQYDEPNGNGQVPPVKKKKMKKSSKNGKKAGKFVACAVAFGLIAGVVFQGVNYGAGYLLGDGKSDIQLTTTGFATGSATSTAGSVEQVADTAMPAIVAITSTVESIQSGFFGQQYKTEGTGSGSGIIIAKDDTNLYVATNNHVIEDATKVQVTFYHDPKTDGSGEVVEASIVGTDPDSDLAVVKIPVSNISADTLSEIKVASLGDSDNVEIGQQVVAIGNALGYGQSVTSGYVSALNRQVQLEDKTMTLMQTDAAINPGNSGGALLNMNGEVIAINSAKYSESGVEGMGYAIPMATAEPILEDIMNETAIPESKQAYLGITGTTMNDQYRQYMGNSDIPSGVYVATVTEGSPAEEAGIYAGDIIVKFDDRDISTMEGLQSLIARREAGSQVTVVVKRQNQNGGYDEKELTVTLGKKTESVTQQQTEQQQSQQEEQQSNSQYNGQSDFWSFFN